MFSPPPLYSMLIIDAGSADAVSLGAIPRQGDHILHVGRLVRVWRVTLLSPPPPVGPVAHVDVMSV